MARHLNVDMTETGLKTEYDISDIDEDKPSSALCLFFVSFQKEFKFKTKLDPGKSSKICKTVLWLNETSKILNNKVGISGEVYILEFALRAEVSYCHERLRKC